MYDEYSGQIAMYKKITHHVSLLHQFVTTSREALVLVSEMIYGIFLTISSIVIFVKIREEVLEKEFLSFDMQVVHFFYALRSPNLSHLMIFISFLGAQVVVAGAILMTIALLLKKHKREAFLMLFIFGMAVIINALLKDMTQRPRPQYFPLVVETDSSFPSGHSMDSFVFYTTLSYFIFHFTHKKRLSLFISTACLGLVALIGISRIYLGVHYPSDVLGGYFGGLAWFTSVLLIDKTLIFFKLFRESREK